MSPCARSGSECRHRSTRDKRLPSIRHDGLPVIPVSFEDMRKGREVLKSETNAHGELQGILVPSELFARYAESDLDRWRQLIGHPVTHVDARWGTGIVEAVSWGSPCDHVSSYVQVRICYEAGWTVVAHSETWHEHHREVSVPCHVEAAIRHCLDSSLSGDEQEECLVKHSRELREQRDREALNRVEKKRQKSSDDDEISEAADG
jgi:hypothetical protein